MKDWFGRSRRGRTTHEHQGSEPRSEPPRSPTKANAARWSSRRCCGLRWTDHARHPNSQRRSPHCTPTRPSRSRSAEADAQSTRLTDRFGRTCAFPGKALWLIEIEHAKGDVPNAVAVWRSPDATGGWGDPVRMSVDETARRSGDVGSADRRPLAAGRSRRHRSRMQARARGRRRKPNERQETKTPDRAPARGDRAGHDRQDRRTGGTGMARPAPRRATACRADRHRRRAERARTTHRAHRAGAGEDDTPGVDDDNPRSGRGSDRRPRGR